MKNPTFSRFTRCNSVFSSALNHFISAFFACIFFLYTRFENTHEAIADAEAWELTQKLRQTPRRHEPFDEANPFTGLLYCADCGEKLYNHRNRGTKDKPYPTDGFNCSSYTLSRQKHYKTYSNHHISTKALRTLVLETIRAAAAYALSNEAEFIRKVREAFTAQ